MISKFYGEVESITFVKALDNGLDLCEIQIEFDRFKIFGDRTELVEYLNQYVEYVWSFDMIDGLQEKVIRDITLRKTVQTVQSTENIKLIPEGNKRTVCNFAIKDITAGDTHYGKVALLTGYDFRSSDKSKWVDLTLIDMESREFTMKLFTKKIEDDVDPYEALPEYLGKYVEFDLNLTRYGYQTSGITPRLEPVELSPEVTVAKEVLRNVIDADEALTAYENAYHILDKLENVIDGEPGYALVRMASEIYMINAIDNISNNLDIQAMKRAVITSRFHLLPHKTKWSRSNLNINAAMRIGPIKSDIEVMLILDAASEEAPSDTKLMYIKIRGIVNDIIDIRRGFRDEKTASTFAGAYTMFNGLL